jgi:hypothetical protein
VAVDDAQCLGLLRLFNERAGHAFLRSRGVADALVNQLNLLGISSICNLVAAIKTARYYEYGPRDVIFLPLTDALELYGSRIEELQAAAGAYSEAAAARHYAMYIEAIGTDNLRELSYVDRKALHNFKYFTWVEQQQRDVEDLRRLWDPDFWTETFAAATEWDKLIQQFNQRTGVLATL